MSNSTKRTVLFRVVPVLLGAIVSIGALAEVAATAEDPMATSKAAVQEARRANEEPDAPSVAARAKPYRNDEELTRMIRKELVSDDSLSTGAKNVGIRSRGGSVVLRGEVRSPAERAKVVSIAERNAGAGAVTDD